MSALDGVKVCRDRMRCYLAVELVAKDNHIFKLIGDGLLHRTTGVPDPRLA